MWNSTLKLSRFYYLDIWYTCHTRNFFLAPQAKREKKKTINDHGLQNFVTVIDCCILMISYFLVPQNAGFQGVSFCLKLESPLSRKHGERQKLSAGKVNENPIRVSFPGTLTCN